MLKIEAMKFMAFLAFAISIPAHAVMSVPKCNHSEFKNISQLAHYFHNVDPRKTFEQYAKATGQSLKAVRQQFGGTGDLKCFDKNGGFDEITAHVVGRNNMIAGSGHIFFNSDCTRRAIEKCEFRTIGQPSHVYRIKVSTAVVKTCVENNPDSVDDWFAAKLTEPTSATPYLIPDSPVRPNVGDQLVQVAYQAVNGFNNKPNIVDCSVMNTQYRLMPYLTDCSMGHGSSGAAQLQPADNHRWVLNAVVSSENAAGHDGAEFDVRATYTSSAPVNGEFWQTLHDMANSDEVTTTSGPHDRDSY